MEKEKNVKTSVVLDEEEINAPATKVVVPKTVEEPKKTRNTRSKETNDEDELVNCLTNETIIVRFIAKARGTITNPKHILFGQMAPGSKIRIPMPVMNSGVYADVLTKSEKKYLEYALGLEDNALSVYRKNDNFWDDSNPQGIGRVELTKGDNYFDLSKPLDYIKVKILKSYKDLIAPSISEMQDRPKATYRFVIISESDAVTTATTKVSRKVQAYKLFGKIENDKYKMRTIIELLEGKPTSANVKLEYLQSKIGDLIEEDTKMFLQVAQDSMLDNKVLIKKAIEAGIISKRGNFLYYKDKETGNMPLCGDNEEPTFSIAAKFLSLPKNQDLKFSIEAKVKED